MRLSQSKVALPLRAGLALGLAILLTRGEASTNSSSLTAHERTERKGAVFAPEWPIYHLRAASAWQLNLPGGLRFDASALVKTTDGSLLTLSDRGPEVYRIVFGTAANAADLALLPDCFPTLALAKLADKPLERYDCEGLAEDDGGRLYICEESHRWILRCNRLEGTVERLPIDWTRVKKYFHPTDLNASFEGIAIGGGRLYVANERKTGRLIVVDLKTLKIVDHFLARPSNGRTGDIHYSDLSWFDGSLYALLRHHRVILKINPTTHQVMAEYDYRALEKDREFHYHSLYPTGNMEGLVVDGDYFWMVTDNNGESRVRYPGDIRPTLFKCLRPDRK